MNQYLFTTLEGSTIAPDDSNDVENCQLLARIDAPDRDTAKNLLISENSWIYDCKFDPEVCTVDQVATKTQLSDIHTLVRYFWNDVKKSFEKEGCPENHIFMVIKRLRDMVSDIN